MSSGIRLTVDFAFKRVFGMQRTSWILVGLLNAILDPPAGRRIASLEIQNPFNLQETDGDKLSIIDIRAKDEQGRIFSVEMQVLPQPEFDRRIMYYIARPYAAQLGESERYSEIRPSIGICIADFVLFGDRATDGNFHRRFRFWDEAHEVVFTDQIELHTIELSKFDKPLADFAAPVDDWTHFLIHAHEYDAQSLPERLKNHPEIAQAMKELETVAQTEEERIRYESRRKAILDERSRADWYEHGIERAAEKARAEGREEGREEGQDIGQIKLMQRLLRLPVDSDETLKRLSRGELAARNKSLNSQLFKDENGN